MNKDQLWYVHQERVCATFDGLQKMTARFKRKTWRSLGPRDSSWERIFNSPSIIRRPYSMRELFSVVLQSEMLACIIKWKSVTTSRLTSNNKDKPGRHWWDFAFQNLSLLRWCIRPRQSSHPERSTSRGSLRESTKTQTKYLWKKKQMSVKNLPFLFCYRGWPKADDIWARAEQGLWLCLSN